MKNVNRNLKLAALLTCISFISTSAVIVKEETPLGKQKTQIKKKKQIPQSKSKNMTVKQSSKQLKQKMDLSLEERRALQKKSLEEFKASQVRQPTTAKKAISTKKNVNKEISIEDTTEEKDIPVKQTTKTVVAKTKAQASTTKTKMQTPTAKTIATADNSKTIATEEPDEFSTQLSKKMAVVKKELELEMEKNKKVTPKTLKLLKQIDALELLIQDENEEQ